MEEIALTFINALKKEALLDALDVVTSYTSTNVEYPSDPVLIRFTQTSGHIPTTRLQLDWALANVAINQINGRYYRSIRIWILLAMNPIFDGSMEPRQRSDISPSQSKETSTSQKSELSILGTNTTSTTFTLPSLSDSTYEINFRYGGATISRSNLFSTILLLLLDLSYRDAGSDYGDFSYSRAGAGAYIYVFKNPLAEFPLFLGINVLEAMARYVARMNIYLEMTFELKVDGAVVATGCIAQPVVRRINCRGLLTEGESAVER